MVLDSSTTLNTTSNNIIFVGAKTQYENLGDLIINKVLLDNLRKYGRLIINDQGVPEWFCEELNIKPDERASRYGIKFNILVLLSGLKTLLQQNSKVYLVLTPGHHYNANGQPKLHQVIKTILFFFIFNFFRVRICRFGASIGPFSNLGKIEEKWKSKFMHFYSLRDQISVDYAQTIGVKRVEIFPDLAWLMSVQNTSNALTEQLKKDDYIVFSFRKSSHELDDPANYKNRLFLVLDEIVKLMCSQWQKKLVISYQVERDKDFCEEIRDRYKDRHNVVWIDNQIDSQSMNNVYSGASMVFSNRLHVLMFAMLRGAIPIPVVDMSEHNKITGIFSDAGLKRLIIDISEKECGVESLDEFAANTSLIQKDIAFCLEKQRNLGDAIFKHVLN